MSIYKKYCKEIVDGSGALRKFTLEYPDNFNFGYDVVRSEEHTSELQSH